MNKKLVASIVTGVLIAGGIGGFFLTTEKIKNGNVGVVYSLNGGVQDEVLTQGLKYVGIGKKVKQYSIRTNQFYLSKSDGDKEDTSIDVGTQGGTVNVDFEMSYSFDPERVADVYKKYGGLSGEDIVNNIVKGRVRSLVNEVTSKYTVADVYVDKRAEVNQAITEHLRNNLTEVGLSVERATLSDVRPDESVLAVLTERSKVAQELENEKQRQEKIRLEAESKKIAAEGEAKAKIIAAEAEAEANRKLQESLTPELLKKIELDKWNGSKATTIVNGNATPVVTTEGK